MSLKGVKRARKGSEGGIMVEVGGIVSSVPQHASICSLVANSPSTASVPIFGLDF